MGTSTQSDIAAGGAGRGANGTIQQRRAQAVEKPTVQTAALQFPHRAGVTIGKNRLRSIRGSGDFLEPPSNGVNSFVPGDPRELALAFRAHALHRPLQTIRVINPVQIARDLLTEKTFGERMIQIAAQRRRPTFGYGHEHAARVRTIMRTHGANGFGFWNAQLKCSLT